MSEESVRAQIDEYIKNKYGVSPEYLWRSDPDSCVYRQLDNKKWFGLIMMIPQAKLGIKGRKMLEIINLKLTDRESVDLFIQKDGMYRAYHMAAGSSWITIVLDGTVSPQEIFPLIDESFAQTASVKTKVKLRPPKEWLMPANPKYGDIVDKLKNQNIIEWKQRAGIKNGDIIYMYIGVPYSSVMYKLTVIETDISYNGDGNPAIRIDSLMKLRLDRNYPEGVFTYERLKNEFSINTVRGARGVPESLSIELNMNDEADS